MDRIVTENDCDKDDAYSQMQTQQIEKKIFSSQSILSVQVEQVPDDQFY